MGTEGRYFVKYSTGEMVGNGNKALSRIIKKKKGEVKMVAFGKEYGCFAVVLKNGRVYCNNVPKGLQDVVENCGEETKTEFIGMGPAGEYFVRQKKKKEIDGGFSVETIVRYGNIGSGDIVRALQTFPRKLSFGGRGAFVATRL